MTTESHSKPRSVTISMYDNGDVNIEIDEGVTAFALWGIIGMLDMQARIKMAESIHAMVNPSGIVVPGRQ